mgnify:CR=1 FL=1
MLVAAVATTEGGTDQLKGVLGGIHRETNQRLALDAQVFRGYVVLSDFAVFQLRHMGGAGQADFVQAIFRVHHHDVLGAQAVQNLRHGAAKLFREHTDQLALDVGRVGHGTEQVERGAHPQLLPRRSGMAH